MKLVSGVTRKTTGTAGAARRPFPRRVVLLLSVLAALLMVCMLPAAASAAISYVTNTNSVTATNSANNVSLTKPSGTSAGDLLLVQIAYNTSGPTVSLSPPTGWTKWSTTPTTSFNMGQVIYYKIAGSSESSSYSFGVYNGGSSRRAVGAILCYSGVDQTTPISAVSANSSFGTALTATAVTAAANSRIVALFGTGSRTGTSDPTLSGTGTSMTSIVQLNYSGSNGPAIRVADEAITAAGSTGNREATASSWTSWVAHLIALNPATVTVTATGVNKVYDGTTAATATLSLSGVVSPDAVTASYTSATFADKNVGTGKTVSVTGITLGGANAGEYNLLNTTATTTANITTRSLTVTATGINKIYDRTTGASVTLSSNKLAGDNVTPAYASAAFADKDVGTGKIVYVSGISISGADATNYSLTSTTTTAAAAISAKALSVSGALAENKVYDGNATADLDLSGAGLVGVIVGDTVTLNGSGATASFADENVGEGKTVTVGGLDLGGTDAGNYSIIHPVLSADITAKALTVTGASAADKVYDGTTGATADFGAAALVGVVGGEDVHLDASGHAQSFASEDVGADKDVTVTGLALTGGETGNYTLNQPVLKASITAKALTVSGASAADKVYNGTVAASLDLSGADLVGVIGGDTVTLDKGAAAGSFADKNVGAGKPVTVTGLALGGADAGNYTVTQPAGITAAITARGLTVTGALADSKAYDGDVDATIDFMSGPAELDGVVGGDTVDLVTDGYAATFAGKHVGTGKDVTVSGLTLDGADAGNYMLTQPALKAAITAAELTITADHQDKIYGDTFTFVGDEFGTDGLVTGESVLSVVLTSEGADATSGAGDYDILASNAVAGPGTDLADYSVSYDPGSMTVARKELTITADHQDKIYGDAFTFDGDEFRADGLVAGESILSVVLTSEGADATSGAGDYDILASDAVAGPGTDLINYKVGYRSGTMTIGQKTLTVTGAAARNKVYDRSTTATVDFAGARLDGVIDGDTVTIDESACAAEFDSEDVGNDKPVTVTGVALGGAQAGNYTVSQPSGLTAAVTAKGLTVTGAVALPKVYDGGTSVTVDYTLIGLAGVESGDDVSPVTLGSSAAFADKAAGANKDVVVAGLGLSGADAGNYTLTQPTLKADITAKGLTVTATGVDKVYDRTTSAAVTLASDKLAGDVVTPAYAAAAFADEDVGTGKIVYVTGISIDGADAGNYSLTSTTTTATAAITAKGLMVTGAAARNKVYDRTTTATVDFAGADLDGVIGGDTVTIDDGACVAEFDSKDIGTAKPVTVTGIALGGADAGNYTVSQPSGLTAAITAKGLTVTGAAAQNKVYDRTNAATLDMGGAALTGVIGGDTVAIDDSSCVAEFDSKDAGAAKPVTVTGLALGGADAGNYTVSQPSGLTAAITAKGLTVTGAVAENKVYDGTTTAAVDFTGATLPDVIGGDTVTIDGSAAAATFDSKDAGTAKPVTVTGVALGGADAGNYTVSQPSGLTAAITAKGLTVTATGADKVYDRTTSAAVTLASDKLAGDEVTADFASATFDSKDVGADKPVTVSGITIGGADAGNYSLTSTTATTTAAITAKNLAVTGAVAESKVYDGTTAATVDFTGATLPDVIGGDTVTIDDSACVAEFDSKDVGTAKPVTITGVALGGADAGNYTVSQPTGLTADITGVTPTITVKGNDDAWHPGPVTLTFTPSVGPYGVDKVEYKIGSGDWTVITASGGLYRVAITAVGANTISYRVTDNAGLVSAVGTCTVKIDTAAPTISMIGISTGDTSWHKDPVTLTFTPHVGEAGLQSVEYQVNGGTWTAIAAGAGAYQVTFATNGTYSVNYRATDNAGTSSAVGACTVKIDNAKPIVKARKASGKRGKKLKLKLYVTKNPTGCGAAVVVIKFYKGKKLKKSMKTPSLTVNTWNTVKWKCTLRKGKYTMKLYATDSIGNTQAKVGTAKLRVK